MNSAAAEAVAVIGQRVPRRHGDVGVERHRQALDPVGGAGLRGQPLGGRGRMGERDRAVEGLAALPGIIKGDLGHALALLRRRVRVGGQGQGDVHGVGLVGEQGQRLGGRARVVGHRAAGGGVERDAVGGDRQQHLGRAARVGGQRLVDPWVAVGPGLAQVRLGQQMRRRARVGGSLRTLDRQLAVEHPREILNRQGARQICAGVRRPARPDAGGRELASQPGTRPSDSSSGSRSSSGMAGRSATARSNSSRQLAATSPARPTCRRAA
ncbi:hypothetical protein EKD04_000640 [Chloroflexales bacterium ZM16-3]|nr:hypothetical protein [Chloroflexales bacterium ZM16-3]